VRRMQNANERKSFFSSAILTVSGSNPYPHFSLEIVTALHDDLSFQRAWFGNLVEKNRREVAKAFFQLRQNRTR
jgi:hypothetical protein